MENKIRGAQWRQAAGKQFENAFRLLVGEFDSVAGRWNSQVERPSYYVAGLSVESYLKACLILVGIDFPKNHKGHDLTHLISLSPDIKKFFGFDDIDVRHISLLNERYYADEKYGKDDLRYADECGTRISPHPESLDKIVRSMGSKLEKQIRFQSQGL